MSPDASLIKIYNERFEFWNPGTLPDGISIDQLINGNYISRIRNVKIASTFKEAQLIERYGSGIKRIQQGFAVYGLKAPLFEEFQSGFRVTVYSETAGTMSGTMSGTTAEKVLELIKGNTQITIPELSKLIKVTERTIERNINQLQKHKKLERVGPSFGGYWKVNSHETS